MKVMRGVGLTLAILILPIAIGILGAQAAVRLGLLGVANGLLGFAFLWGDAIGPNPFMLFLWGIVGLVVGQLTAERSLARTVGLALVVVPIVAAVSFVIARALGHHPHGGI
jgi:hypothetical protein